MNMSKTPDQITGNRGLALRAFLAHIDESPERRVQAQADATGLAYDKVLGTYDDWLTKRGGAAEMGLAPEVRARIAAAPIHPTQSRQPRAATVDLDALRAPRTPERLVVDIPAEESSASLHRELVLSRIRNFWGYGSLSAPVWFVGMEESIPPTISIDSQELWARFEAADGRPTIDMRKDMQDVHDHIQWFQPGARIQPTWRWPIALLLYLTLDRFPTAEEIRTLIRKYQTIILGDVELNESVGVELMPLPSQKSHESTWLYGKLDAPGLNTRSEYLKTYKPERLRQLAALLREYKPSLVIVYTVKYLEDLKALIDAELDCISKGMYAAQVDGTLFCIIPQNSPGLSDARLFEYADRLRKQFTIPQLQFE
jgi:hypothetical protein